MADMLTIEVVYALSREQDIVRVRLPAGSRVATAVEASGLRQRYPEIDLSKNKVGVFGSLVDLEMPLANLDRVEIYRPLVADAKEMRRARAAKRG